MSKRIGSWWIKDGIDGRRIEAQGFASILDSLSGFVWTEDHGDSNVLEKDFVDTSSYTEKSDEVDALMMSSHGNTTGFATSDGRVTTSDSVSFGKNDLEVFATHACKLLEHTSSNSVGRWIPAFDRLHYLFGFHNSSYSGGGQNARGEYFAIFAVGWFIFPSYPLRDAWRIANSMVEDSDVEWAYLRCTGETSSGASADTYNEKLTTSEPNDPTNNRSFWTKRGSC